MSGRVAAVFLDRDGTIIEDVNYCRRVEDVRLIGGAAEAISLLNKAGFKVVVITNQSGIARGYFSESTLRAIHERMISDILKEGGRIDAIYYCPHHPDDGCRCRKPRTALFERAARELSLDIRASYVVGDRISDILAGKVLGCTTVFVETGPISAEWDGLSADYKARNLLEGAKWIITHRSGTITVPACRREQRVQ